MAQIFWKAQNENYGKICKCKSLNCKYSKRTEKCKISSICKRRLETEIEQCANSEELEKAPKRVKFPLNL